MARCEEALHLWRRDLMGLPVDQNALEAALEHISGCSLLCAQTLGIEAPAPPNTPEGPAGVAPAPLDTLEEPSDGDIDYYEALGSEAEEQGNAHAKEWDRLAALAASGMGSMEVAQRERNLAHASWQAAWTAYDWGWQLKHTVFLREGRARLRRKTLPAPALLLPVTSPPDEVASVLPEALRQKKPTSKKPLPSASPLRPGAQGDPVPPAPPEKESPAPEPPLDDQKPETKPGARRRR